MKQTIIKSEMKTTVPINLGIWNGLKQVLGKAKVPLASKPVEYWVEGSSLVYIPKDRLNDIPGVMKEYRRQMCERNRYLVYSTRLI